MRKRYRLEVYKWKDVVYNDTIEFLKDEDICAQWYARGVFDIYQREQNATGYSLKPV